MGQRLRVRSQDGEEHIRAVARYLDEQIRRLADTQLTKTLLHLALVTALNVASDYWKLHREREEADKMIDRMAQRMHMHLRQAARYGKEKTPRAS